MERMWVALGVHVVAFVPVLDVIVSVQAIM